MKTITEHMGIEDVAATVCDALLMAGIEVILTGGAVVSIYTKNEYQSWDLDFVKMSFNPKIHPVMEALGFTKERSRHYEHPRTKIIVEFPGSVMAIGDEPIKTWNEIQNKHGVLRLLAPTECVMDRLAAYYYWNDRQGLEQAVMVACSHPLKIKRIEIWSKKEKMEEKFSEFKAAVKKRSQK